MPRYLFYVDEGSLAVEPDERELPNTQAAKAEAMKLFSGILLELAAHRTQRDMISLRVASETGLTFFEMSLLLTDAPVLHSC
jgi:hypothetical protein